ncbi:hypothetical protein [Streptomyces sp. TP-A0874]|uniref:hypothetical protein n=1 Tax=Streptomyces sp. TP-A0874 TaxID=549819 RepID=UPI000A654C48|nr:hypothetical protein [Streptomyces sp. TP-A0874]
MMCRAVPPTRAAACAALLGLALLTGCGSGEAGGPSSGGGISATGLPDVPSESRAPVPGKGTKDPDDINGDGYRDLRVSIPGVSKVAVLYGSAEGLDLSTRTLHGPRALGLPVPADQPVGDEGFAPDAVADLDGDGFPDFVTTLQEDPSAQQKQAERTAVPCVTWGGPEGPAAAEGGATPLRPPSSVSAHGLSHVTRGDFDGDGHHDLVARAMTESVMGKSPLVVLYGPFTRSGEPARTDTSPPVEDGELVVDDIAPSGGARATPLLVHEISDGEQSGNLLYSAERGRGLSWEGRRLREGNARAFGDFDGDGRRDVAVGDDGSHNNEPGADSTDPAVIGSLDVYPGGGGGPVKHRLPEVPEGAGTYYGPGGFAAADPDGDGRDGILVATYEGAVLIEDDQRIPVLREMKEGPDEWRHARPAGAADFDGDGKDELVLNWATGTIFGLYGAGPTHWWITDGTTSRDQAAFVSTGLVPKSP